MTKQDIINYVTTTPHNTNKAILNEMLDQLAGGEDSDFAIANVTLTDTSSQSVFDRGINVPNIYDYESYEEIINPYIPFDATSPYSAKVPLYKGKSILYSGLLTSEVNTTVESGNAEVIHEGEYDIVVICGDCEITFSDSR